MVYIYMYSVTIPLYRTEVDLKTNSETFVMFFPRNVVWGYPIGLIRLIQVTIVTRCFSLLGWDLIAHTRILASILHSVFSPLWSSLVHNSITADSGLLIVCTIIAIWGLSDSDL